MLIKMMAFLWKCCFGTYLDFSTGCWVLLGLRAMVCSTPRLPLAILFTKWRDLHQQEIWFGARQILQMFMSQIFGCYQLSTQPPTFIGDDLYNQGFMIYDPVILLFRNGVNCKLLEQWWFWSLRLFFPQKSWHSLKISKMYESRIFL